MNGSFQKHRSGRSGAFTAEYHQLLGSTPWIVVKRLLRAEAANAKAPGTGSPAEPMLGPSPPSAGPGTEFSEGDIATVFSQFGEVTDVRFVRNRKTGKFLGTAFVRFADFRSGIAAADTMNSNMEENDLVVLSPSGEASARTATGIVVERCEEVEVPAALASTTSESYGAWVERVCGGRIPWE